MTGLQELIREYKMLRDTGQLEKSTAGKLTSFDHQRAVRRRIMNTARSVAASHYGVHELQMMNGIGKITTQARYVSWRLSAQVHGISTNDIAEYYGVHASTVMEAVRTSPIPEILNNFLNRLQLEEIEFTLK